MSRCEYCHTDIDDYVRPLDKNAHVYIDLLGIDANSLRIDWYGKRMNIPINYCPICGRNLKGE